MKYQELVILLPCHSLEDFPLHHEGEAAEGLLACWTALWHPALLAAAGAKASWYRVDDPPAELHERLIVVPPVGENELATGFGQRAQDEGACVVRHRHRRDDVLAAALESLDGGPGDVDPELAADFLALGYCYLQVELLTRQMRYSSNLDEIHFGKLLIAGAQAALQQQEDEARQKLTACFNLLTEERDHYYPVDAYVLDLMPIADTTMGVALRDELREPAATNLLISANLLQRMADREPETLASLRQAVIEQRVGIAGGERVEGPSTLLSCETLLRELQSGLQQYEALLGQPLQVYGRRRFGLTPALPQILQRLGLAGCIHATLDDGRFPEGTQVKTRWEGADAAAIDALARAPLDASKPETFLSLALKLGESMDMDHVATLCLAHWPGHASTWHQDLRRIARYSTALGKFVTLDHYFRETDLPGHLDRFEADQYRSPYLQQAVVRGEADPISRVVTYWQRQAHLEAIQGLQTLRQLVAGRGEGDSPLPVDEVDQAVGGGDDLPGPADAAAAGDRLSLDTRLEQQLQNAAQRFAAVLPRVAGPEQPGCLVLNPCSFVRRVGVELPGLGSPPAVERPVYAAGENSGRIHAVVDVPPMGFAWVTQPMRAERPAEPPQPLAEEGLLRNEFFEVMINRTTGSLQAIHEYGARTNRLSQQLAFRTPTARGRQADDEAPYSVMAADSIEVTAATPALGELTTRGRLLDRQGKQLAAFTQIYQVWRGSRVLLLDMTLEPLVEPRNDPWNSYYACRFAWADEAAEVYRAVNQQRHLAAAKRLEAPQYLEIVSGDARTAVLTGGLPFHRRHGFRMLDSLLITRGERARRFRMGIGIDLKNPMHDALGLLLDPPVLARTAEPPAPASSSWLFHLDARNVLATNWQAQTDGAGASSGLRVRLLETAGRPVRCRLRAFRAVRSARLVDFRGETMADCNIQDGEVQLELGAGEWVEVEAQW